MPLALSLAISLLTAAGDCHVITNTMIVTLPTCDVSPSTIFALTERPAPSTASSVPYRAVGASARPQRRTSRPAGPTVAPPCNDVLERRLESEQRRRIRAVARRVAAEQERDAALQQRDAALRELAIARRALGEVRARGAQEPVAAVGDVAPEKGASEKSNDGSAGKAGAAPHLEGRRPLSQRAR